MILAAVSISAAYNSEIVNYAINGTMNYAQEAVNENRIMQETESMLDSAISRIEGIMSGEEPESKNEDITKPNKASLTVVEIGADTIKVTAEGEDDLSGVAKYSFQYKERSEETYKVARRNRKYRKNHRIHI